MAWGAGRSRFRFTDPSAFHERFVASAEAVVTPRRAELHRLADSLRVAIECLMDTQASEEALADAAAQAEALAVLLQSQPRGRTVEGWAEVANAGDTFGFFDFSPVFGRANPLAPPVAARSRMSTEAQPCGGAPRTKGLPGAFTAATSQRRSTKCSA